jgi:beta-glucanase (GH16 family)
MPRHAAPRQTRLRKRWFAVPAFAAVPLLIGGVAMAAGTNHVSYRVTAPVTVQALGLNTASPIVGQPVSAGAKVVAEHTQTFDYVVLAVRDQAGHNVDFPGTAHWTLGTTQRVYTSTRTFSSPGDYTYWFAYFTGGTWTNLSPKRSFTVLSGVTATPTANPSAPPSAMPTPEPTATASASPTAAPTPQPTASSPSASPTATGTMPAPPTGNATPVGVSGTWTYKFGDDFNGPIAWGSKWADSSSAESDGGHGNTGNQQLEWNQAANCSTANGVLSMTAKPANITSPSGHHYNWSSCLLSSSPSYAFRYGYIEVRAQLTGPKGFWPAFWTWQAAGNNQWTETDVFEFYSDNHSRLYLTQHSGAGGGTVYNMPFDPTTGFHTYGADIEPNGTRFYVDGKLVATAAGTSTGMTNIILDNFVYSVIPPVAGTTGTMRVDYVRAWQH